MDALRLFPDEKHRLYSEHAPDALEALEEILASPGPSPVLVLAGEPGCGRTGLLEAAAPGAFVLPLDLGGYEEGLELSRFAELRIAKRWDLDEKAREELGQSLAPLVASTEASLSGAALVSLLLQPGAPAATMLDLEPTDPRERLLSLLRLLGRDRRLILHAVASSQLTDPLRLRLLEEARTNPALILAISCSPGEESGRVAARSPSLRLDLTPLPAGGLLDPVKELLDDIDLEAADRLQRFLDLAALCGEDVPAEILFHHLEMDEEQQEELLDVIDEDLVEPEDQRLFIDHQYGHPSFPGLLTYSFLSPRLNHALVEPLPEDKRRRLAAELLEFMERSVPLHTRGMTLLRLALADRNGDPERRASFARDLRVWIGEGDVDDLAADFTRSLEEGTLTPENLLGTAQETEGRWPPHVRLAFVQAAGQRSATLSPEARAGLHLLRAEILRDLDRRPEALEEARRALETSRGLLGSEDSSLAKPLTLLGVLLRETGQPREAQEHLEQALAIQGRQGETDGLGLASVLAQLGAVLRDLGQREAARDHLLQALSLHRQLLGDSHPAVAGDLNHLATVLRELGDARQALEFLRPVVDIVRSNYGDVHPSTAQALTNVAGVLRELGETEAARGHIEAALEINQQAFGDRHPQVAADLNNLAVIEKELGDLESARGHIEKALALAQGALGEEHPLTKQLRRALEEG